MPSERTSFERNIKDIEFRDERAWIYATVRQLTRDYAIIDDGTGTLRVDIAPQDVEGAEGPTPCAIKGKLTEGAFVRVIGNVLSTTSKEFTIQPVVIQNLDELGVDKKLLERVRAIEKKIVENA